MTEMDTNDRDTNEAVLKRTPLDPCYPDGLETEWIDVYGYAVPLFVSDPETEYGAFREHVGIIEYSMLFKWDLRGPGAKAVANAVYTRELAKVPSGKIVYGAVVNADGFMLDDATVTVYSDEHVMLMGGNAGLGDILRAALTDGVELSERREEFVVASVQGPKSRTLLQRLTDTDLSNEAFPYYTFKENVQLSGVPVQINRIGYTAELGYEVMAPIDRAVELHAALTEAGADLGVQLCGAIALMMCRTEAGMVMGEVDYDHTVTPFECRLGWAVDLEKDAFLGREALLAKKDGVTNRTVSIRVDGDFEGLDGAAVSREGNVVGAMSMVVPSPVLGGATLGLARIHRDSAKPGTKVIVAAPDGPREAEVIATPVYDPERTRVHS